MSKLSLGFSPPRDFPVEFHSTVRQCINKYTNTHNVQVRLFRLGWNGLVRRYRAMAEYDEEYTSSIRNFGNSPPPEERYQQEKSLFGFFINAVSVVDCFFFSTYCIASILKPDDFPISQPKDLRVFRGDVRANFKEHFPQERLYQKMSDCLCEEEFIQLNNFRIVLSHRGTPPRSFEIGGENDGMATMPINPKYPSDQWENDFPVDAQTTTTRRQWLCDILEGLMDATVDFCNRQLP